MIKTSVIAHSMTSYQAEEHARVAGEVLRTASLNTLSAKRKRNAGSDSDSDSEELSTSSILASPSLAPACCSIRRLTKVSGNKRD